MWQEDGGRAGGVDQHEFGCEPVELGPSWSLSWDESRFSLTRMKAISWDAVRPGG